MATRLEVVGNMSNLHLCMTLGTQLEASTSLHMTIPKIYGVYIDQQRRPDKST